MRGLIFTAVLSMLLLLVWERVDIVRVGYQIERLKAEKIVLQREHDELHVRLSALTSPERIARAATERLSMALPERGQVVLVHLEPEPSAPRWIGEEGEVRLAKHMPARRLR